MAGERIFRCNLCDEIKSPKALVFDRHRKHYCVPCAIKIELCEECGSTNIDDNTIHGQLHYDDRDF